MHEGYINNLIALSLFVFSIMLITTKSLFLLGFYIVVYSIIYYSLVHFKILNNSGIWFSLFIIGVFYAYLVSQLSILLLFFPVSYFLLPTGVLFENDYISVMFFVIISVVLYNRRRKALSNIDKYLYVLFLLFFPTLRHYSEINQNEICSEYGGLGAWMYGFNYNYGPYKCIECEGKITIFNDFWLGMQFLSIILGLTVFIVVLYFRNQNIKKIKKMYITNNKLI